MALEHQAVSIMARSRHVLFMEGLKNSHVISIKVCFFCGMFNSLYEWWFYHARFPPIYAEEDITHFHVAKHSNTNFAFLQQIL